MVNHVRTLLANRDGGVQGVADWDEYVDPDHRAARLDGALLRARAALLGPDDDPPALAWRLAGIMVVIHASSLAPWAVASDPRLSYDPSTGRMMPLRAGTEVTVDVVYGSTQADAVWTGPVPGCDPGTSSWVVSLQTGVGAFSVLNYGGWMPLASAATWRNADVDDLRGRTWSAPINQDVRPGPTIALRDDVVLTVPVTAVDGDSWLVRMFTPPDDGPFDALSRLIDAAVLDEVLDRQPAVPASWRKAWYGRDDLDRLAAAALIVASRIDQQRSR